MYDVLVYVLVLLPAVFKLHLSIPYPLYTVHVILNKTRDLSPTLLLKPMSLHRDLFKQSLPEVTSIEDFSTALAARLSLNIAENQGSTSDPPSRHASRSGSIRLSRQDSRANTMLKRIVDDGRNSNSVAGSNGDDSSANTSANGEINNAFITIPNLLNTLSLSTRSATRSGIGHTEREVLLSHLYRMIISPASETYMGPIGPNDEDFATLISLHATADSRFEWEAWLRCAVSYACVGIDDVASDVVDLLFPLLLAKITPEEPTDRMESAVWSFMACLLFVYHGAENHGMLHHAAVFAQHADTVIANDSVQAACLYTVALALSLAWEGGRDMHDVVDSLIDSVSLTLASKGRGKSKVAAAILAGVLHEVNPDNDYTEITQTLEPLANEGTRKAGKKGKLAKNVFKDVKNSITNESTEIDSLRLSKTKTIRMSTWSAYVRMQVLRFVFAAETNAWIGRSREIRSMLKVRVLGDDNNDDDDDDEDDNDDLDDFDDAQVTSRHTPVDSYERKMLEKERSVKLKKERLDKVSNV